MHGTGCPRRLVHPGRARWARAACSTRRASARATRSIINTLNHPTNSCNAVVAGETAMMGKEHFIETFGVPVLHDRDGRIGRRLHEPADRRRVSRHSSTAWTSARRSPTRWPSRSSGLDAHLLTHYFTATDHAGFTDAQKVAVSGYRRHEGVHRRRESVAAHRSGAEPRRHRGLPVGALERRGARVAPLRSGEESEGRAADGVRRRAQRLRQEPGDRRRASAVRQRRRPVRPERAQERRHHRRAVPRSEREDRRLRSGRQLHWRRARSATPARSSAPTRAG